MIHNTDDWKGEHLIRAPKRELVEPTAPAPTSMAYQKKAADARREDAEKIAALAGRMTRAEIRDATGMTMNRVNVICQKFKIRPVDHKYSATKRKQIK